MAGYQSITIVGSFINLYVNNRLYKVTESISLDIDYGEEAIFGIDTPWPQEIAGGKASVRGNVRGMRIKNSGGVQGFNLRPLFTDLAASPYVSIRVQDRSTSEDIFLIPNAKVSRESHEMAAKGIYKLNFDFTGQIILMALDRITPS